MGKFSKIKKHSKSFSYLDEKIGRLNADIQNTLLKENPTNNTSSFNAVEPTKTNNIDSIKVDTVLNLLADDHTKFGSDTSGIFDKHGRSVLIEPPGYWRGTSLDPFATLGPMISYYDPISDTTYLGYVRENDRSMVNLGRISGKISNWDQENNFTSYGQLSLEQAQWYYKEYNNNGVENYRVFYSGKSDSTDPYNRVFGKIISTPKNNVSTKYSKKKYIENIEELIKNSKLPFNLNPENFLMMFNHLNSNLNLDNQTKTQEMLVDLVLNFNTYRDGKLLAALMSRGDRIPSNNGPSPGKLFTSYQTSGRLLVEEESDPQPFDPRYSPQKYTDPLVTGGGRVETYPEGESLYAWLVRRANIIDSEGSGGGGDGSIAGYFSKTTNTEQEYVQNVSKIFRNTSVSAKTLWDMETELDRLDQVSQQKQQLWSNTYSQLAPQRAAAFAAMETALAANDFSAFYTALAELNRLNGITDALLADATAASAAWVGQIRVIGQYVRTGRIFSKDPYQVDDPTVALARQRSEEQKKKDATIKNEIEKLKQAASDSEKAAILNRLKAYGLGALVAGFAVLGVAALFIPAVNAALGPAVIGALRTVFNVFKGPGDDALSKIGAVDDVGQAGLGQISGQLADDAASVANKLLKSGESLGPKARSLANSIDDAASRGDSQTLQKLLKQADDLLTGRGSSWTPKPQTSSKPKFDPTRIYDPKHPAVTNSYKVQGQVLSEDRKRILRDLKKPVILPEAKQEKIKHRPKVIGSAPRSVGENMMKQAEVPTSFKPMEEKMWGKYEQHRNARASQERKNQVLDLVGTSDHAWEWITETIRKKGKDVAYENFSSNTSNNNTLKEQETLQADKDPLFKRVVNKLKPVIDYPDKPSPGGFPDSPPPNMLMGYHPEYGERDAYYNTLDPHSANAMPATGNKKIDDKVQKARRIKKLIKGT